MSSTLTGSGTTTHTILLNGLVNNQNYTSYVRCQDSYNNVMTSSASVAFRVQARQGDLNYDNTVNILDIVLLLGYKRNGVYTAEADLNSDTELNIFDIIIMVNISTSG
jgi:hypothetical protein